MGENGVLKNAPLVSVIIPCYNAEKYIDSMAACLIRQTYTNLQIIFVDDGSTDKTVEQINKYLWDSRISLIKQDNQYAGVARNNGMRQAKGEYICFFDVDDEAEENMIEMLVNSIETYESDIAICNLKHRDSLTGKILPKEPNIKRYILEPFEERGYFSYLDVPDDIMTIGFSGPYNKIYRRKFLTENELIFQNTKRDNDESFVLTAMAAAEKISWVYDALYTYNVNNPLSLQGFGDFKIDVQELLSTVEHTKDELKRLNKYNVVKYSFCKGTLARWHYLLEQQRTVENYCAVYQAIKDSLFEILELDRLDEDSYIIYKDHYKKIMEYDVLEFLFWKNRVLSISDGETYLLPFDKLKGNIKKICIYGAGNVGKAYIRQIIKSDSLELVAVFDKNYKNLQNEKYKVCDPALVNHYMFDILIIAIEDSKMAKTIMDDMIKLSVQKEKIMWPLEGR